MKPPSAAAPLAARLETIGERARTAEWPRGARGLAALLALSALAGCERGSSASAAARPEAPPASPPVAQPPAEVVAAPASAPSASDPPAPAEGTVATSAASAPEPPQPSAAPADGSCNVRQDCVSPATCARENAFIGKHRRSGSYCTTPRDLCQAWDDQKCGARAACLYSKSAKRWTCQPVTMRGLVD